MLCLPSGYLFLCSNPWKRWAMHWEKVLPFWRTTSSCLWDSTNSPSHKISQANLKFMDHAAITLDPPCLTLPHFQQTRIFPTHLSAPQVAHNERSKSRIHKELLSAAVRIPEQASCFFPQRQRHQKLLHHNVSITFSWHTQNLVVSSWIYGFMFWFLNLTLRWPLHYFHLRTALRKSNVWATSVLLWMTQCLECWRPSVRVWRWQCNDPSWHHSVETPSAVKKLARGHFGFCQAPAWEYKFTTENNQIETTWNNTTNTAIQDASSEYKPAVPLVTSYNAVTFIDYENKNI